MVLQFVVADTTAAAIVASVSPLRRGRSGGPWPAGWALQDPEQRDQCPPSVQLEKMPRLDAYTSLTAASQSHLAREERSG
jgi:hypothetical protein